MIEKVSAAHPDKVADRIAGALVDLSYAKSESPKVAVEVLIGHGICHIINETSCPLNERDVRYTVKRIAGNVELDYVEVAQDVELAKNQEHGLRCGDNGIFKGMPITREQLSLSHLARDLYSKYRSDGKYLVKDGELVVCQSNVQTKALLKYLKRYCGNTYSSMIVNPLGDWTGGTDVDCGATNRKLGSDMGDSITGGGLHGKDLSKADVSVNIYAFIKTQALNRPIRLSCAIGDDKVDGLPYSEVVAIAKDFIDKLGGFEKLAEWGLF